MKEVELSEFKKRLKLAQLYFFHFIRLFKSAKGPTPTPSLHPSRPSFDTLQAAMKHALEESPIDQRTAKAKVGTPHLVIGPSFVIIIAASFLVSAMRGPLNGAPNSAMKFAPREATKLAPLVTQAAHIFPASLNKEISVADAADKKAHYTVWTMIDRFAGFEICEELNGPGIHSLENILTLSVALHDSFDYLRIWFEETDMPNTYRVCGDQGYTRRLPASAILTFTTPDPVRLPLPSSRHLSIHAACCKVAQLSGAGEYSDKIFRDVEDTRVLAFDGSSAEVLNYALIQKLQVDPVF